jgi:hypothetical protein
MHGNPARNSCNPGKNSRHPKFLSKAAGVRTFRIAPPNDFNTESWFQALQYHRVIVEAGIQFPQRHVPSAFAIYNAKIKKPTLIGARDK